MEPQDPDATHGLRRCASAPADLLRLRERDTFAGDGRNETQEPPVEPDEAAAVTAEEVIKPLDEFEDFLQKKAYSNNQAEQLYHAYKAIKNIPSYDMLRSLVYLDKFYEAMPMKFENCDLGMVSFEALLHGLEEFLQKPLNQEFRLCILNDIIPPNVRFEPGRTFLSNLLPRDRSGHPNIPTTVQAIILALERTLGLSSASIYKWDITTAMRRSGQTIAQLQSFREIAVTPSHFSTMQWNYTHLYWFKDFEVYSSDIAVYISQLHLRSLKPLGVTICAGPVSPEGIAMLILCRSSKSDGFVPVKSIRQELSSYMPAALRACTIPQVMALSTMHSIYSLLLRDTSKFLDCLLQELEILWGKGKHKPSVDKMNYILYLSEGSKACQSALLHSLSILEELKDPLPLPIDNEEASNCLEEWQISIKDDIDYLRKQLRDVDTRILQLRTMIKEQLDLRQFRLSTPLAILAAIYLPFSFVSTFFGMNISDPLWGSESKIPTPNTTTWNNTNTLSRSQNQTDSIVTAIATSGSHLFTFKEFLYVAISITVITLGIPLLGAKMFRGTIRFAKRNIGKVRILWILFLLGYLIAIPIFFENLILIYFPQIFIGVYNLLFETRSWLPFYLLPKQNWEKKWMIYIAVTALCAENPAASYDYWTLVPSILYVAIIISANTHFQFQFSKLLNSPMTPRPRFLCSSYPKRWIWTLLGGCIALGIGSRWVPILTVYFTSILFGTYLGLYGIDKLRSAIRVGEGLVQWGGFLLVVGGCITLDIFFCAWFTTLPVVPVLYRVFWCLYWDDQIFIKRYLPEWIYVWRRRRTRTVDEETGSGVLSISLQSV